MGVQLMNVKTLDQFSFEEKPLNIWIVNPWN